MSKLGNKHTKQFEKCKIHVMGQSFEAALDFTDIGKRLDMAQHALDKQVWDDVQQYMPFGVGNLISETNMLNQSVAEPGEAYCTPFLDEHPYAHYVYEGEVYVDPDYGKGAFYSPNYGFWSRPEVTKVPSGRQMVYTKPSAVSHWDEVAVKNHKAQWIDIVKRFLG
jgi:hypothetical protein